MLPLPITTTPSGTQNRVLIPLNWNNSVGLPTHGDSIQRTVNAQPRGQQAARGVSFFEPAPGFMPAIHKYLLGQEVQGCIVTMPDTPLPPSMLFVNDKELELKLYAADSKVTCGQHWTLSTTTDMPASEFEAGFRTLLESCVPCDMQGGAEAELDLDVDMDELPGDRLTRASVMALDNLAQHTGNLHVKLFAHLYALHMRANDMAFEEVLHFEPMASMVAAALGAWTVRDPFLLVDVCNVQERLSKHLETEVAGPKYEPYWVVHPFQFMGGMYNDQLYDEQVKACALMFVGDNVLKALVRDAAVALFTELALSCDTTKYKSTTFQHKNRTFEVRCGDLGVVGGDSSSNSSSSKCISIEAM